MGINDKFLEVDKAMSKQIAKELAGKEWDVTCETCSGTGFLYTPFFKVKKKWKCKFCDGQGTYKMTC